MSDFFSATSIPLLPEPRANRGLKQYKFPGLKIAFISVSAILFCLLCNRRLILVVGVSTLFTSFHVWLAVQMCFFPAAPRFGWQGVVPRKAGKMASLACDLMLNRLLTISEVFGRLDGEDFFKFLSLSETLRAAHRAAQARLGARAIPRMWAFAPEMVKSEILERSLEISEKCICEIVSGCLLILKDRKFFDVKQLIVSSFVRNPATLSHFFLKIGESEISFLKFCGAGLGALSGVGQLFSSTAPRAISPQKFTYFRSQAVFSESSRIGSP